MAMSPLLCLTIERHRFVEERIRRQGLLPNDWPSAAANALGDTFQKRTIFRAKPSAGWACWTRLMMESMRVLFLRTSSSTVCFNPCQLVEKRENTGAVLLSANDVTHAHRSAESYLEEMMPAARFLRHVKRYAYM
jgi:hypothetical protein